MSLIDHAKRVAAAHDAAGDDLLDGRFPADDADSTFVREGLGGRHDARQVLPMAALLEALGPAGIRRVQTGGDLAVVVEIPNAAWAPGVENALRALTPFQHIVTRTGAARTTDRPTEGNATIASKLSAGLRVAGISQDPRRYLPATLIQAADLYVRIGTPSNRVLAETLRAVTGRRVRRMPPALAAGLDFDTLTSAMRLGTTPAACIARLQAASRSLAGGDPLGDDVPDLATLHGYGQAMQWALALVRDLDEWRAGRLDFSSISRCCTLASAPGLGKSSLIRSIAKAAKVPLVSANVAELFTSSSGYLDGILKSLEAKVLHAASLAPAILFLDEIDSIPNRATMDNRARDFWTTFVNGVLQLLDSTTSSVTSRLIIIGATNNVDQLDAALLRPGRLFPVIRIEPPDADALAGIVRQHLGGDLTGCDLSGVARLGVGATGAQAAVWVKSARSTARAEGRRMTVADLVAQVAPPDTRTQEEIRICALHEAAHGVAAVMGGSGTLTGITIIQNGTNAGAATTRLHNRAFLTRTEIEAIVVMVLAGRAMDVLEGVPHTGAGGGPGSDLHRASEMVIALHAAYGLGQSLLYRSPSDAAEAMRHDPAFRRAVEADLARLFAEATRLVRENRPAIEAVAERLVAARVLSGAEVEAIVAGRRATMASRQRRGSHAG